ncbi:b156 [miniopterid betaherpesvirus 1]|uniref:B156 n=1 Tax=miniopterid betaherpesvirus 1 TaxID=3070189 RepID=I3VQF8_9BETA|nr:b156 [miniopterid betaherpesvirus 1]AFK84002.1 b156 [miniopterid betaherpesvirus 1]
MVSLDRFKTKPASVDRGKFQVVCDTSFWQKHHVCRRWVLAAMVLLCTVALYALVFAAAYFGGILFDGSAAENDEHDSSALPSSANRAPVNYSFKDIMRAVEAKDEQPLDVAWPAKYLSYRWFSHSCVNRSCSYPWIGWDGVCFYSPPVELSWWKADAYCGKLQYTAELAGVRTSEELDFLLSGRYDGYLVGRYKMGNRSEDALIIRGLYPWDTLKDLTINGSSRGQVYINDTELWADSNSFRRRRFVCRLNTTFQCDLSRRIHCGYGVNLKHRRYCRDEVLTGAVPVDGSTDPPSWWWNGFWSP